MQRANRSFSSVLLAWYGRKRREFPWRSPPGALPEPYHILVSEFMLQQTQAASVIPYFQAFLKQFPTFAALAAATDQQTLRAWQGLGYYSRARNLHATAREIVASHDGKAPESVESLLSLPGIGRYTAGAIASIAFDQRAPILDGNVARVLCRLDKIADDPRDPKVRARLWRCAEEILPRRRAGDFNSALMDLGATICTPRNPRCPDCPALKFCESFAAGAQDRIPLRKKSKPTPLIKRWTICIRDGDRWLIEQRPPKGRWAGMWQFVTMEASGDRPTASIIHRELGLRVTHLKRNGKLRHALTHRRYEFEIFQCEVTSRAPLAPDNRRLRWLSLSEMDAYPLPRPQEKIRSMLTTTPSTP